MGQVSSARILLKRPKLPSPNQYLYKETFCIFQQQDQARHRLSDIEYNHDQCYHMYDFWIFCLLKTLMPQRIGHFPVARQDDLRHQARLQQLYLNSKLKWALWRILLWRTFWWNYEIVVDIIDFCKNIIGWFILYEIPHCQCVKCNFLIVCDIGLYYSNSWLAIRFITKIKRDIKSYDDII